MIEGGKGFTDEDTYFTCIDPATGAPMRVSYVDFRKAFEQTLTDANPKASGVDQAIGIQIIYFPEDIRTEIGYNVGFTSFFAGDKPPVHESMVLRALKDSNITPKIPESVTRGSDKPTNEFLRGVFWNDDPSSYLFDIKANENMVESHGYDWGNDFKAGEDKAKAGRTGEISKKNIIGRSHFGDLQFLHAMGSAVGEMPSATFSKILLWVEIMYRLATGQGVTGSQSISSVNVVRDGLQLSAFFTSSSRPTVSQSMKDLLAPNEKYTGLDLARRALGSLLHVVQDSFAKGHTQRTLLNPGDRVDPQKDDFKPGTWAKLGDIQNYHTYMPSGGQAAHHADYDKFDVTKDWTLLWGGKDAIAQSIIVVNFWFEKKRWEDGVEAWAKQCFKFAAGATPSNTDV